MFLADENIDRVIVDRLRADGHDVLWVAELAPGLLDEEVLALANDQGRVLITADKDFGEHVFRQQRVGAVLLLRLLGLSPDEKAAIVAGAVRAHGSELAAAFSVVSPTTIRIRAR